MQNSWLSVIIPAYNCSKTIEKTLWSIVNQGDPNIEVIICDDNSTDNFMEKVIPFANAGLLDIKYCKTSPREIHCPGNTRRDAWKHATGEWITFIDNDDEFEPYTFTNVKEWIRISGEKHLLHTKMRGFNLDTRQYTKTYDAITWMHGKFYNRQWLIDNGIDFKENLYANEDLYFNGLVYGCIMGGDGIYMKADFFSYRWNEEPTSISRSFDYTHTHSYVETYFHEYVIATSEPWFIMYQKSPQLKSVFFDKQCYILLHCYLYYQLFTYVSTITGHPQLDNLKYIKELCDQICVTFGVTIDDIINDIYEKKKDPTSDPYTKIKKNVENSSAPFIEYTSFKDFVRRLYE